MENQKKGKIKGIKITEIFKNRRNVWIIGSVGVVVILAIILIMASLKGQAGTSSEYQTTSVTRGTLTSSVEGSGTVASLHTITLSWQTSGQVEKVNVQIGDKVKTDDVLAFLLQSSLSSNVISAQANLITDQRALDSASNPDSALAQAQVDLINAQNAYYSAYYYYQDLLVEDDPVPTTSDIDKAKATMELKQISLQEAQDAFDRVQNGPDPSIVAAAQAKVDADQAIVNQAQIISPFDGTVTQVSVNPGDVISAGTKAFRIDDLDQMVVSVQVTEIDVNSVKAGQLATVTFDAIPNKTYDGTVVQVDMAGTVSQSSTTFNALVKLTNSDELVKPGMAANVTIVTNNVENALLVPSTAVFTDDTTGQQYVYLVKNGGLEPVIVTIGASSDTSTQITSDNLQVGDTIVLSFTSSSSSTGRFGMGGFGAMGGSRDVVVQDSGNPPALPVETNSSGGQP